MLMNLKNWDSLDLEQIINYLENVNGKVVLGLDGIIDEVWQVLETRISKSEYKTIDKMRNFGELIVNRGEGGMANELIRKRRICGGFTANTGRAIGNLEVPTTMIGMYGKETIDPIYDEFKDKCTLISLGNPAVCNILEFPDGKIMLPYLKELLDFEWKDLVNILGHEKLKNLFCNADIVSLGYWSNMPTFNELIENIYENYFSDNYPKRLFFDFANIKKRSVEALKETIEVLGVLNNKVPVTLSLNEHEAALLFSHFGKEFSGDIEETGKILIALRDGMNFDELIIHTPDYCIAASQSENLAVVAQDHCGNPVRTAGAGDTFNGGYIAACLNNLNINERLAIANAATSFYVNNGYPADRENLIKEIKRIKGKLAEI